jgi:hypothetical protein
MKLTYWVAERLDDSPAYSIRERTRKAAKNAMVGQPHASFGTLHKVTVEYDSAFDLLKQCLQEGGIGESMAGEESLYHADNDE